MPLVILHHLLNVSVQLANKRGLKKYFLLIRTVSVPDDSKETHETREPQFVTSTV
jgi:hypothetical protein